MSTTPAPRPSARERLLDAADELFYAEGINTVGIDRVIERAGVAKASLYNHFGSKDELVGAYLARRHASRRERLLEGLSGLTTPRERLLGVFDVLGTSFAKPGSRGCAFINAGAEAQPGSATERATDEYRGWVRSFLVDLASEAGAPDPEALGGQLALLYDGTAVAVRMDHHGAEVAAAARVAAAALLDTALAAPRA